MLPDLEQHRVEVDRFAVDRDPGEQGGGPGHLAEPGEQVIEQHIVGGQGDGLGQGGIQAGAGGQPPVRVGAV